MPKKLLKTLKNFRKRKPQFLCLYLEKRHGELSFHRVNDYESRLKNTEIMIKEADDIAKFPDFSEICVSVDDKFSYTDDEPRMLSVATRRGNYERAVPDFLFISWPETGVESFANEISHALNISKPKNKILGWRGAGTHPARNQLLEKTATLNGTDIEMIVWNRKNPSKLIAKNYKSFLDQLHQWRYFIDVEGRGYSARLKLYLAAQRLVFVQDRELHEFYWENLLPFKHYIPVRNDFSDLEEKLDYVRSDPKIELEICENLKEFRENNLCHRAVIEKWVEAISNVI